MKKITNQKIDISKLFERYMTYIYSIKGDLELKLSIRGF